MAIITTKVGPKYQVTIPRSVREALKLEAGDLLEVRVAGRDVLLKPKVLIDRDPELEQALAEAEEDIKAGRVYGPFDGAQEAVRGLRRAVREERRRAGASGTENAATPKAVSAKK
ncbi:MAG: AbrB/MazE/SpoVT family DNA-binding domain-containing protein [Candidatus Binataceae bacterium]